MKKRRGRPRLEHVDEQDPAAAALVAGGLAALQVRTAEDDKKAVDYNYEVQVSAGRGGACAGGSS